MLGGAPSLPRIQRVRPASCRGDPGPVRVSPSSSADFATTNFRRSQRGGDPVQGQFPDMLALALRNLVKPDRPPPRGNSEHDRYQKSRVRGMVPADPHGALPRDRIARKERLYEALWCRLGGRLPDGKHLLSDSSSRWNDKVMHKGRKVFSPGEVTRVMPAMVCPAPRGCPRGEVAVFVRERDAPATIGVTTAL
jgi:hypothetical protein